MFLGKFEPRVAANNYNALAISFGPSDKASEAIFSVAVYPRWVSLFFLQGAKLSDPDKLLKGSGTRVRHLILTHPSILEQAGVMRLMSVALMSAKSPLDPSQRRRLIIKSISAKQRPRRP
jgi:hypothetical protein